MCQRCGGQPAMVRMCSGVTASYGRPLGARACDACWETFVALAYRQPNVKILAVNDRAIIWSPT